MGLSFNIAIDGHSSCGKSTIAKYIAKKYAMRYVDTGAMYRAVTLYCMQQNIIQNKVINFEVLLNSLQHIEIDFRFNYHNNCSETFLNNENVEHVIRNFDVSDNVSKIARIKEVRQKLILLQQEIGKSKNVVMDGRDIGTKVFPNAKLKLFVTAKPLIRARRRFEELQNNGYNIAFSEVLRNINERDKNDMRRKINPLVMSDDAVLIDNSDLSIEDQNNFIENLINNKL